jgi:hypothetical protein
MRDSLGVMEHGQFTFLGVKEQGFRHLTAVSKPFETNRQLKMGQ